MKYSILTLSIASMFVASMALACNLAQTRSADENPHNNVMAKHAGILKAPTAVAKNDKKKSKGNATF